MADVVGIGRPDIEALVEKTLRRVGMGVDHQGGVVDGSGFGADARGIGSLGARKRKEQTDRKQCFDHFSLERDRTSIV